MKHDEKKLLRQLQELEIGHEARKRRRQEAKLRRGAREDAPRDRFDDRAWLGAGDDERDALETAPPVERGTRREIRPPQALARAADTAAERPADDGPAADAAGPATVSTVAPGLCRVRLHDQPDEEVLCRLAPTFAHTAEELVVGDEVTVRRRGTVWRVESLAPRRTRLARPDPANPRRERLLAANVDLVIVASAVVAPGVKPGLIDRMLIAAQAAGAAAVVCVNKIDLLSPPERAPELLTLSPYVEAGVPVLACSATTGEGLDELAAACRERIAVLVGQSGCGKSSLVNALTRDQASPLRTGVSRESDGKGRHTTTASSLRPLPGGGALIDTPGVRQFGLWQPSAEDLERAFPDVAAHALRCRFRDCHHRGEPGCAVVEAVAAGTLRPSRLASFLRLRDETE